MRSKWEDTPFSSPWKPVQSDGKMGPERKGGERGPRKEDKGVRTKRKTLDDSRTRHLLTK